MASRTPLIVAISLGLWAGLAGGCQSRAGATPGRDASTLDDAAVADAAADGARGDGRPPGDAPVDSGEPPTITVGAPDRLLLLGTIVTPQTVVEGAVLVEADLITCVDSAAVCGAMPGAAGATVIDTKGIIAPGMVDTHNHILFDMFDDDDWLPTQVYQDHDQWPDEPRYQAMLDVKQCLVNDSQGKPAWCANTVYGTAAGSLRCEAEKWGELKGLIAGTTSIVGLAGISSTCFGSLARSVDTAQAGLGQDKVQTSALFPPSSPSTVCTNFASGKTDAFLVHVGEGTDAKALAEFAKLGSSTTPAGCLYAPQTAITHGTAFTSAEFTTMAQAGMKLIWSPHSNVSLYGQTADIPTALTAGVTVAIAPDWSMGGSPNLLDELRFAAAWDHAHWGDRLTAKDLVVMATVHGAQAVALDAKLGTLAAGQLADLAVFAGDRTRPYDAIVAARPERVRLVVVGGTVLYGDATLAAAAPVAPGCEAIDICGAAKFLCVATTSTANKFDQTYAQIKAALTQGMIDADAQTPGDGYTFAPLTPIVTCPK
ncbi:MAG TPA: amidohydrolase family protein [Kofleriaceae bacterium]|jgi:cytosine/adenosine deaminase-related metal-dependent hydrolase|nr:amidohydrolase family protein [Kofleriaceae bacterium]